MKIQQHNLILIVLLLAGSLGLAAWWNSKLPPLLATTWQSIPPELTPTPPTLLLTQDSGNTSLERPLFWESRRPLPPQTTASDTNTAVPMELLGIVIEGQHRTALLRPKQGTPPLSVLRLHQGQSANGTTLKSIDNDQVILETTSGLQTLQLKRGSQNPNTNQPAKLSAPQTIEATPRKRQDAAQQAQPPAATPLP